MSTTGTFRQHRPILVTGATGTVGTEVVRLLADRGATIRAFVRDPKRAREKLGGSIELAAGDFSEPETVRLAAGGCGELFLLTRDGPDQVEHAVSAARAAVSAGVEHIVKLSSSDTGPDAPFSWARDHYAIERAIEALGVGFSHLRAHYFMQNLLGAIHTEAGALVLRLPMGSGGISAIDARDVASCAAAVLASPPLGRAVVITGGRSFTLHEAASTLSRHAGIDVRHHNADPADYLAWMVKHGEEPQTAASVSLMYQWCREGKLDRITEEVERLTGLPPRGLDEFAAEVAGPELRKLSSAG
jgi:uncharacterized protein YbjT (DUF2867 family)